MKIYIFVDLEGISGVSGKGYINSSANRPDLIELAKKMMTQDVNACVSGCFKAGVDEVIVKDGHSSSCNMTREGVDPRADFIDGDTPRIRFADIQGSAGLILLGYHAMAGTEGAVLEHTFSSAGIQNIWLNGRKTGEIGIDAAIAAEYGVPVIMVSGDDKTCAEAKDWLPGVTACEVKKGFSCNGARMPSLEKTHRLIEEKTIEAIGQIGKIKPLKIDYPVTYKVELVERGRCPDNAAYRQIDARTYELECDSVEKALLV